ncbi:MAG TPA: hypothetical protein VH092_01110 [Urbifossiella sp.]|nr:hypothetical protein [Urbifossiella sp.]
MYEVYFWDETVWRFRVFGALTYHGAAVEVAERLTARTGIRHFIRLRAA